MIAIPRTMFDWNAISKKFNPILTEGAESINTRQAPKWLLEQLKQNRPQNIRKHETHVIHSCLTEFLQI
jgi:hypothetical protein